MKKTRLGQELIKGLQEALEYEKGLRTLRTTPLEIPDPAPTWSKERIAKLRKEQFKVSQPLFAAFLSVTASTVKAWEQGLKTPSGAASRLLELADLDPEIFQRLVRSK